MRPIVIVILVLATITAGAQIQPMPQKQEPLKYLSLEEVKKQIAEAVGLPGPEVPTVEERKKVVAEVNGTKITLDQVLREVIDRFGGTLIPGLLNQSVMSMEAIKRGIRISEEEFVEAVQIFLAQKKTVDTKEPLRKVLIDGQMSWNTFVKMISDKAKIEKVARSDLNMAKAKEPLNPFVLQIWAGQKLRGQYSMEMDAAKLQPGVLGVVSTTRLASDVIEDLMEGGFKVTVSEAPKDGEKSESSEISIAPQDGGWPRYTFPNIPIHEMTRDGRIVEVTAAEAIQEAAANTGQGEEKSLERYIRITPVGGKGPGYEVPGVKVEKQNKDKGPKTRVSLREVIDAVGNKGFTFHDDGTLRSKDGGWPAYTLPVVWFTSTRPGALVEIVKSLEGVPCTAEERIRLHRKYDIPDAPVAMKTMLDREVVLGFSFGKLQPIHYEAALESLSRSLAVKQTFKAMNITVDEKAVRAIIDAENARYNHPLFNRKMILQAKGKTEYDENNRIWVGNGVDQVIGSEVDEKILRKYYEDNILHFGRATVEASHILIEAKNPKTGKIDLERARNRIDKIAMELFSHPNPAAIFPQLAQRFSEDAMTAKKGGALGAFTLKGQMAPEFAQAAFALGPREISAPVKTVHGYHLILCTKRTKPDLEKYSFQKKEIFQQVKEEHQQERRDRWLKENVYDKMKVKNLSDLFPSPK